MNLLQGIQLPELIMLILGFILGLALIFIFIFTALRGKPNLYLLVGFIVPALLIGYPSYKSTQFGNNVVKIEQLVEKVNENPTDIAAQKELIDNLGQLPASRCVKSADAMTSIANAQASLGQYDSARVTINKAVELDKTSAKALEGQKDINEKWEARERVRTHVRYLDNNIKDFEKRPNDKNLRDSIANRIETISKLSMSTNVPVHLENQQVITIARAAAIVGRIDQGKQMTQEVLKINPNQKEAINLKKDFDDKKFQPQYKPQPKRREEGNETRRNNKKNEPAPPVIAAPVTILQDTSLKLRFTPKGIMSLKKWNNME
jgi:tetratricopeptide (TPR) repeat protein